jgi:hypothetical protein
MANSYSVGDLVFSAQDGEISVTARVSKTDDDDDEYWAEIELKGSPSAEAWRATTVTDNFDVFAFGVWMDGPGLPVYWGDIDGDGKPELLAPLPKGDLSPPIFRIFRWTGDDLLFLKKRALVSAGDGKFEWMALDDDSVEETDWVENFQGSQAEVLSLKDGYLKRELISFKPLKDGIQQVPE